jgi:hypothetical protein
LAFKLAIIINWNNIAVFQLTDNFHLTFKALEVGIVFHILSGQHFHRYFAIHRLLMCEVNGCHPAFTHTAQNIIAADGFSNKFV